MRRYPTTASMRISRSSRRVDLSLFGPRPMTGNEREQLRYALLRLRAISTTATKCRNYPPMVGTPGKRAHGRGVARKRPPLKPVYSDGGRPAGFQMASHCDAIYISLAPLIWLASSPITGTGPSIIAGSPVSMDRFVATVEEYNRESERPMGHALCREKPMEGPLMPGKGSTSIRIPESKEASHQFSHGRIPAPARPA